ncbi:MAG: hypothetical protein KGJ89_02110 [Patescibacteria group bacterium]|nr:hypothetical protein [Patescibacteria group bacterium]MDE2226728.1 hypothetical protein [Patescibacteria group bacterium]
MTKTIYQVFTDESGAWNERVNNKTTTYVRCWVKIPLGDKAISLETIFNPKSTTKIATFFTFSDLLEFRTRKIIVREEINKEIQNVFLRLQEVVKGYMHKLPKEIEDAINRVLFLYIYERWAWEDAKQRGVFEDCVEIFIHKPQFTKADYQELFRILDINQGKYSFIKGDGLAGIKIADGLARTLRRVPTSDFQKEGQLRNLKLVLQKNTIELGNIVKGIDKVFL